ncbi:hypothetical protein LUZ60_002257 [Juncus effusus]|nr:hypothetical protein LUZ60_002257 [Juncus effusus]
MSAIQVYKGITILPSSKCFIPKFFLSSYLKNGHDKSTTNICCSCLKGHKINYRRKRWALKTMINETSDQSSSSNTNNNTGTRLFKTLQFIQKALTNRVKKLRKGLSVKILFFLIGFYCATAFATVIGQTGDWDILSAGLAVVVVEGIGAMMYKGSFRVLKKIKALIAIFNFWKAGLAMGLFLDAFKYEVDEILEYCVKPFDFDFDIFKGFFW